MHTGSRPRRVALMTDLTFEGNILFVENFPLPNVSIFSHFNSSLVHRVIFVSHITITRAELIYGIENGVILVVIPAPLLLAVFPLRTESSSELLQFIHEYGITLVNPVLHFLFLVINRACLVFQELLEDVVQVRRVLHLVHDLVCLSERNALLLAPLQESLVPLIVLSFFLKLSLESIIGVDLLVLVGWIDWKLQFCVQLHIVILVSRRFNLRLLRSSSVWTESQVSCSSLPNCSESGRTFSCHSVFRTLLLHLKSWPNTYSTNLVQIWDGSVPSFLELIDILSLQGT
jgi:hypothetical protein